MKWSTTGKLMLRKHNLNGNHKISTSKAEYWKLFWMGAPAPLVYAFFCTAFIVGVTSMKGGIISATGQSDFLKIGFTLSIIFSYMIGFGVNDLVIKPRLNAYDKKIFSISFILLAIGALMTIYEIYNM